MKFLYVIPMCIYFVISLFFPASCDPFLSDIQVYWGLSLPPVERRLYMEGGESGQYRVYGLETPVPDTGIPWQREKSPWLEEQIQLFLAPLDVPRNHWPHLDKPYFYYHQKSDSGAELILLLVEDSKELYVIQEAG